MYRLTVQMRNSMMKCLALIFSWISNEISTKNNINIRAAGGKSRANNLLTLISCR
jgi:hypothetical protein